MEKRILFRPEREQSRDLTYSEYSASGQVLHILLQDRGLAEKKPLLDIFRFTIASYLSLHRISRPVVFLGELVEKFEKLLVRSGVGPEELKKAALHFVIISGNEAFLLTSHPNEVWAWVGEAFSPIAGIERRVARKLPLTEDAQGRLFPSRLSEFLSLYLIGFAHGAAIPLLIGCPQASMEMHEDSFALNLLRERGASGSSEVTLEGPSLENTSMGVLLEPRSRGAWDPQGAVPMEQAGMTRRSVPLVLSYVMLVTAVVITGFWVAIRVGGGRQREATAPTQPRIEASPATAVSARSAAETAAEPVLEGVHLSLLWRKDLAKPITSSPCAAAERVFFGSRDGHLYCLDAIAGEELWKYRAGGGVGASPVLVEGSVVCADYTGRVFCLDAEDGSLMWQRPLPAKVSSSPVVVDGRVAVGCYDGRLYSIELRSGRVAWKFRTGGKIRATPVLCAGTIILPSYDRNVYGIKPETGGRLWSTRLGERLDGFPATAGNRVVVGSSDGFMSCLDATSGKLLWKTRTGSSVESGLLLSEGQVIGGSSDKHVYCLDIETGKLLWKFQTGASVLARPVVIHRTVAVASYDGKIYVLDRETGELLESFEADGPIFSSPLFYQGKLYFGTNEGGFYCLEVQGGA